MLGIAFSCIKMSYLFCLLEHFSLSGHTCCLSSHRQQHDDVHRTASSITCHPLPRTAATTSTTGNVPGFGGGLDGDFVPPRAAGMTQRFYELSDMAVRVVEQIQKEKKWINGRSLALEDKHLFALGIQCTLLIPLRLTFII